MKTLTKVAVAGVVVVGAVLLLRRKSAAAVPDPTTPGEVTLTELVVARDANGCGCFLHTHNSSSGTISVARVPRSQCEAKDNLLTELALCDVADPDDPAFVPIDTGGFPVGSLQLGDLANALVTDIKNAFGKLF